MTPIMSPVLSHEACQRLDDTELDFHDSIVCQIHKLHYLVEEKNISNNCSFSKSSDTRRGRAKYTYGTLE